MKRLLLLLNLFLLGCGLVTTKVSTDNTVCDDEISTPSHVEFSVIPSVVTEIPILTTTPTPTPTSTPTPTPTNTITPTPTNTPVSTQTVQLLGYYKLTAYCNCSKCTGSNTLTASGTVPKSNHTIAVNGVEFGTKLQIGDTIYVVEDRGGMGYNVIDIYFDTHQEALEFGARYDVPVYIVE